MSFRSYRKEMEKKLEEKQVLNALHNAEHSLEKRRNEYVSRAKNALKQGNKAQYTTYVAMLKHVMFNLAQTQDMLANYQIAIDLRDMQSLSQKFVKAINTIMKDVYKASTAINVASSQKIFSKALLRQNVSAKQLQILLQDNQFEYKHSVDNLSDISDEEVRALLEIEIRKDEDNIDETLARLEAEFSVTSTEQKPAVAVNVGSASVPVNSHVDKPVEQAAPVETSNVSDKFTYQGNSYRYPSLDLLSDIEGRDEIREYNKKDIENVIRNLETKFKSFNIDVHAESYTVGAAFSRIELRVVSNTPLAQIARIEDDISMALKRKVRLLLPIEGKDLIGVEVANDKREILPIKELISQCDKTTDVTLGIGFDINYKPRFDKLDVLPHLLVGGTTGSGKSIFLHSLIMQMLFRYSPEQVRLILVDFKRVEMGMYRNIPHLFGGKIVDEYEDTIEIFRELVDEMERRYSLFLNSGVRNIDEYNAGHTREARLPSIVAIVDEYADIMGTTYEKPFEQLVLRLVQKARASGIHLILATQRPSVKVISGNIKANLPTRISFAVPSHVDSMNILDASGAQNLISRGDMMISFGGRIERLQSPYVAIEDINKVTKFILNNNQ